MRGRAHAVQSVDLREAGDLSAPVSSLDHFRVTSGAFGPRLQARASAATYVLEDSRGSLRSRDSLGNDVVMRPGGLVWMQGGCGVMHEHLPAEAGQELHGLHVCINPNGMNRQATPAVSRLEPEQVPVWRDSSGDRVRVVAGSFAGIDSPFMPTKTFTLLDIQLRSAVYFDVRECHSALVYVLAGMARVFADGNSRLLEPTQAVAIHNPRGSALLQIIGCGHLLILSDAVESVPAAKRETSASNQTSAIETALARLQTCMPV